MCAGAILNSRVTRLVFGAADPKAGSTGTLYNLMSDPRFNHEVKVIGGVLVDAAATILSEFFSRRRA
jgi:tRNA(adenine34) deaminase